MARAIASRCSSPPERASGLSFSRSSRPTRSSAARARWRASVLAVPVGQQARVLENQTHVTAQVRHGRSAQLADIVFVDPHRATARALKGGDELDQGGLAGARMAGQQHQTAGFDGKADAGQGSVFARVGFMNLIEMNHAMAASGAGKGSRADDNRPAGRRADASGLEFVYVCFQ